MAPITNSHARLKWTKIPGTHKYKIRWRAMGDTVWNCVLKDSVWSKHWVTGLDSATTYEWQIRSICKTGPTVQNGVWSSLQSFTTPANKTDFSEQLNVRHIEQVSVYPNPNRGVFTVELGDTGDYTIEVFDVAGRSVLRERTSQNRLQVDLGDRAHGMYVLKLTSDQSTYTTRVVVR